MADVPKALARVLAEDDETGHTHNETGIGLDYGGGTDNDHYLAEAVAKYRRKIVEAFTAERDALRAELAKAQDRAAFLAGLDNARLERCKALAAVNAQQADEIAKLKADLSSVADLADKDAETIARLRAEVQFATGVNQQASEELAARDARIAELERDLATRAEDATNYLRVCEAIGIVYEAWGVNSAPGPIETVLERIEELKRKAGDFDDLEESLRASSDEECVAFTNGEETFGVDKLGPYTVYGKHRHDTSPMDVIQAAAKKVEHLIDHQNCHARGIDTNTRELVRMQDAEIDRLRAVVKDLETKLSSLKAAAEEQPQGG